MEKSNMTIKYVEWALITLLYVTFFLPISSIVPTILLFFCYLLENGISAKIEKSGFLIYMLVFIAFCYISCIWATNIDYCLVETNHIFKSFWGIAAIYLCTYRKKSVDYLLKVVVWGGYIVLIYCIIRYGFGNMISHTVEFESDSERYINPNVLSSCVSYAVLVHLFYGIRDKFKATHLLIIPALIFIASTETRKSLITIGVGLFLFLILNKRSHGRSVKSSLKFILMLVAICIIIVILFQLPAFSAIKEAMDNLFAMVFSNSSNVDNSLQDRSIFIEYGLLMFKSSPLIGVGIGNARVFNIRDTYLHNNFVEMLADGGIIGFVIYYFAYIRILVELIKNKSFKSKTFVYIFPVFVCLIISHIGLVAYRNSYEYFYLLLCLLECDNLISLRKERSLNKRLLVDIENTCEEKKDKILVDKDVNIDDTSIQLMANEISKETTKRDDDSTENIKWDIYFGD